MREAKYKVGDRLIVSGGHPSKAKHGKVFTVSAVRYNGGDPYYMGEHPVASAGVWEFHIKGLEPVHVDLVNHPPHYTSDPSGVECIQITRHRNFNIGNAFKYLWRLGLKESASKTTKEKTVEDIDKAIFYLQDERARIEAGE